MKLLKLYQWIAGKMTDFISQFQNNDSLYQQARTFWGKLEGISTILLIIALMIGILFAVIYYKPYNNKPGRHYTPKHWIIFLVITFVMAFLLTLGFEYFAVAPHLKGKKELKIVIIKIENGNQLLMIKSIYINTKLAKI